MTLQRFWDKVQITPACWNWVGGKNKGGYGRININGSMVLAHRYLYKMMDKLINKDENP